ncbi:MAG TPA: hypothetical protein DD434_02220 [Bacteroidales bacterium]|nr:hypothetical protein [Bacteroidales bacterium]
MFIRTFKKNYTLQIILIIVLPLLLWMPAFMSAPEVIKTSYDAPFYNLIYNALSSSKLFCTIIAFIIVLFQGILINIIFSSNQLSSRNTLLPGFIYILLLSTNYNSMTFSSVLIFNALIIIGVYFLFKSFDKNEGLDEIYNASLFISLAFLTYIPSILLILWIFLSFLNYRFYKWRYWLLSFFGFLTPILFILAYYFITSSLQTAYTTYLSKLEIIPNFFVTLQPIDIIFYIVIGIFALISLFNTISSKGDCNINYRKKTNVLIILLFISLLASLYCIGKCFIISFLALPLCYLFFNFFTAKRKLIYSNIYFTILLSLIIIKLILSL